MSEEPDIIVADKKGQAIAVIEVKDRPADRFDAAEAYKRFYKYKVVGNPEYFLLVTRGKVSLWKEIIKIPQDLAAFEFKSPEILSTEAIFKHYKKQPSQVGKGTLDFLIFQWLVDLSNNGGPEQTSKAFQDFKKAIQDAHIRFGARG